MACPLMHFDERPTALGYSINQNCIALHEHPEAGDIPYKALLIVAIILQSQEHVCYAINLEHE